MHPLQPNVGYSSLFVMSVLHFFCYLLSEIRLDSLVKLFFQTVKVLLNTNYVVSRLWDIPSLLLVKFE